MKTIKTLTLVSVLMFGIITPAFASWWNPFTWSFFTKRQNQKIENGIYSKDSKFENVVKEGGDNNTDKKEIVTSNPVEIEKIGLYVSTSTNIDASEQFRSSLKASSKFVSPGGISIISWKITDVLDESKRPICKLKAKAICVTSVCSDYTKKKEDIINVLLSENTDNDDPNGSRPIEEALNNPVSFDSQTKNRVSSGKKTIKLKGDNLNHHSNMKFTLHCSGKDNSFDDFKEVNILFAEGDDG